MKTILQVDDDANDVFLLQHAMRKMAVKNPVQVVSDGQAAIDYLRGAGKFADREKFPYPCLVLMDLKLPYVMGLDVLRWIRAQPGESLMVILLTASAAGSDISEAYRLGANAFLTKPSEASKLEDMVGAIKGFWLTHNTLPPDPLPESLRQGKLGVVPSFRTLPAAKSLGLVNGLAKGDRRSNGAVGRLFGDPLGHSERPQVPQARSRISPPLTKRQTETLQRIAEGQSTREIAREMGVSLKTVEKHRQAVMDKLGIHEIANLTRYAISIGLVRCSPVPTRHRSPRANGRPPQSGVGVAVDVGNAA